MDLLEHQAKTIFGQAGVTVTEGRVATRPEAAAKIAAELGTPVVVKAQVRIGGRGKAGGVKVAADAAAAQAAAEAILGMDIRGHTVGSVLVEPAVDIANEIYLGLTLDRGARAPVMMASSEGGVDIEQVAAESPEAIARVTLDPLVGFQAFHSRDLAFGIGLDRGLVGPFTAVAAGLAKAFDTWDATLVEVNPLVVTRDGNLVAIDAKMSLDDNAAYRHPEAAQFVDRGDETEAEAAARLAGLSYVSLGGTIGCLVKWRRTGHGDDGRDLNCYGGEPANFLDIGGGAQAEKVEAAMRIILSDERVRSVLINIFGGITRGDEVAKGLLAALDRLDSTVPIVARIVGTNAEEARGILAAADLATGTTLADAARKAVELAGAGGRK